jgi:hypothetical protein
MNQVCNHIGVPTKEINLTPKQIARFWKKVEKGDGCWEWIGKKHDGGYGLFLYTQKHGKPQRTSAHRVAYTLVMGHIRPGGILLHSCDNKACCNPGHLRVGDNVDNMRDRLERNRMCKGAKIGMDAAREIRRRVLKGEAKRAIAREFGVYPSTIRQICQFKTWVNHKIWGL